MTFPCSYGGWARPSAPGSSRGAEEGANSPSVAAVNLSRGLIYVGNKAGGGGAERRLASLPPTACKPAAPARPGSIPEEPPVPRSIAPGSFAGGNPCSHPKYSTYFRTPPGLAFISQLGPAAALPSSLLRC